VDIVIENANGDTLEKLESGDNTRLATLKDALGGRGKLRKKSDKVLKINPDWIVEPGTYVWSPDEPPQQQANGEIGFYRFGNFVYCWIYSIRPRLTIYHPLQHNRHSSQPTMNKP